MKAAGLPLFYLAAAAALAAEDSAPTASTKTSARLAQEIRAPLPKFVAPPAPAQDQPKGEDSADPEVLPLPKFTVKEKRPLTHDPDIWLTEKSIQQKAMAAYKQSMSDLEWALNSWYIPLVSPPASARARGAYRSEKFRAEVQRLGSLIEQIGKLSPESSAALRQEMINLQLDRPPGSK